MRRVLTETPLASDTVCQPGAHGSAEKIKDAQPDIDAQLGLDAGNTRRSKDVSEIVGNDIVAADLAKDWNQQVSTLISESSM